MKMTAADLTAIDGLGLRSAKETISIISELTDTESGPLVNAIDKKLVGGTWVIQIRCPYCQETHTHGGGRGIQPYGGHRIGHCAKSKKIGYSIVV